MSAVTLAYDRYEAIEFSGLNNGDGYRMLVRYPSPMLSSTSSIDVFSSAVSCIIYFVFNELLYNCCIYYCYIILWHRYGEVFSFRSSRCSLASSCFTSQRNGKDSLSLNTTERIQLYRIIVLASLGLCWVPLQHRVINNKSIFWCVLNLIKYSFLFNFRKLSQMGSRVV